MLGELKMMNDFKMSDNNIRKRRSPRKQTRIWMVRIGKS